MESHEHTDKVCVHPECEAGRMVAARVSNFFLSDQLTQAGIHLIMAVRDCGYAEASAWAMGFLNEVMGELAIREITRTVDEELKELTSE